MFDPPIMHHPWFLKELYQDLDSGQVVIALQLMPSSEEWDSETTGHVNEKFEAEEGLSFARPLER